MFESFEDIIKAEVSRKIKPGHFFFDDLCQEARIAILLIEDKIDRDLPHKQQVSFVRKAVRWHISRVWRMWVREAALVSEQSLRDNKAILDKIDYVEDWDELDIPDESTSPEDLVQHYTDLIRIIEMFKDVISTPEEQTAFIEMLKGTNSRAVGAKINRSHTGAIKMQKRLIKKVKKLIDGG